VTAAVSTQDLARRAYAQPGAPVRTPRATEYDLFARITRRLREADAAARGGGAPARFALIRALNDNRELWTTLAADVASDGNGLPAELRARLFALAEFVRRHSARVIAGDGAAGVLIDINTAVMRGLGGPGGGG
jgi:flagellar protein FlaF